MKEKRPWRRHFLIQRQADWLRDVMAADLGGPAKVAAYALATWFSHRTMAVQISVPALAKDAGMSERQVKEALAVLANEGWITRKDGGRHPNTYQAIECRTDC